jgi:hypothetical protein
MRYAADVLSRQEEAALLEVLPSLPFKESVSRLSRQATGRLVGLLRLQRRRLRLVGELPDFLLPVRERAAQFAGVASAALER